MFHLYVQKVLPSHDVDALTVPSKTPPLTKGECLKSREGVVG